MRDWSIEAGAREYMTSPGQPVRLSMELVNRSPVSIEVVQLKSEALALDSSFSLILKNNDPVTIKLVKNMAGNKPYSSPYWLSEPHGAGLFTVKEQVINW